MTKEQENRGILDNYPGSLPFHEKNAILSSLISLNP